MEKMKTLLRQIQKFTQNKSLVIEFLVFVFLMGCASFQDKKETTLLLEEIKKDQGKEGVSVDETDLWQGATVKKRWVPAQFRGSRVYVPGHYEYFVETPGHWKTK